MGCQTDQCAMVETGKDVLLEYCTTHPSLLCMGWIHTHPTFDCFLSSIDLHTTFGYQQSLPEAIAVVVSHHANTTLAFRLTPAGMGVIRGCHERGFHQHATEGGVDLSATMYEEARGVVWVDGGGVVDARSAGV